VAANYKVNIQLDTKTLDKQLKDLGVKIDKVGKVKQGQGKKQLSEAEAAVKLKQQETKEEIKQIQLRNQQLTIETGIKKVKSQMKDINKTEAQLDEATKKIKAKEFDLAKRELLLSKEDLLTTNKTLAAEKKVTAEKAKQVNLQSAGMNLIRLSGRAGKLGGRTAAVIDQQTALRQPKGLPSSAMLNAEARGIKRLGQTPSILGPSNRGIDREIGKDLTFTATSAKKAAMFEERINKARKRGIANNKKLIGSEVARNKQTLQTIKAEERRATSEARRLNQALRNPIGPSSPLNRRGGQVLPGPAGFGRGSGITSALISGAFPLLFGQGPLAAAGGFTGGLIGDKFGGQMGGFAGGLIGTATVTAIQGFTVQVGTLGAALNKNTKDVTALSGALGITGTEFEKQLKTLEKLGDGEAAFEAARQKMVNLVGQDGVNALTKFGSEFTELGNNFAKIMTLMKASFANFLQNSGIGKFIAGSVERTVLLSQAEASGQNLNTEQGIEIKRLIDLRESITPSLTNKPTKENLDKALELLGREKGSGLFTLEPGNFFNQKDLRDATVLINDLIVKQQKLVNEKDVELEAENMIKKIQESRIKNIDEEIALLKRTRTMSSEEFEIEQKIMEMKRDKAIEDENAIKRKLQELQLLEKERQLAQETAEAFKQMQQTIATDIADGIQGMIRGTSTLNDVLSNVLNKLIDASFNMAFFGNMQGSLGGGGGLFGSVLGLFGRGKRGGGVTDSVFTPSVNSVIDNPFVLPKAAGGPVKKGGRFLVGERGPELFTPGVSGMITPNHALGGSTNVVVNVDASGSSVEGDEQQGRELGRLISVAVQSELIEQKRPGGLLA